MFLEELNESEERARERLKEKRDRQREQTIVLFLVFLVNCVLMFLLENK